MEWSCAIEDSYAQYTHMHTHIRACQETLMKTKELIKHDSEERWAAVLYDFMGSAIQ